MRVSLVDGTNPLTITFIAIVQLLRNSDALRFIQTSDTNFRYSIGQLLATFRAITGMRCSLA